MGSGERFRYRQPLARRHTRVFQPPCCIRSGEHIHLTLGVLSSPKARYLRMDAGGFVFLSGFWQSVRSARCDAPAGGLPPDPTALLPGQAANESPTTRDA